MSEVVVEADLETAWNAITDAAALSEWFGADVDIEAAPLGKGTFRFPDGTIRFAIVEEVRPQHRLAWRWWPAGDRHAATRVVLDLEPVEEGTRVTVMESAEAQ